MKLLHGNTFEIIKTFENESFDLICTDPPFGQNIGYGRSELGHRYILNDDNLDWLNNWAKDAYRVLKQDKHCVLFWQWRTYSELEKIMLNVGFEIKTVGIWNKKNAGLGSGIAEQYEQIIFFKKGKAKERVFCGNVFSYSRPQRSEHPHAKPVELLKRILEITSDPNDNVLDCFMGSGQTGLACKQMKRNFTGIEIADEYFNLSRKTIGTPVMVDLFQ